MITRYPGSKPFTIEYQQLFFGRDKDIAELSKMNNIQKITVLDGKSGLGKSSLLNAGAIPKLQKDKNYQPIFVRFGSYSELQPTFPLDVFNLKIAEQIQSQSTVLQTIDNESQSLWQTFKTYQLSHPTNQTVLLVFDQFEELFTYPHGIEEFALQFAEVLNNKMPKSFQKKYYSLLEENPESISEHELDVIEKDINLKVVFSIRSDRMSFMNRLADFIPSILKNCYELKPLSRAQAQAAIIEPSQKQGEFISQTFEFQAQAIEQILNYLTQNNRKDIETFQLQIVCQYVEESLVVEKRKTTVSATDLGNLEDIYKNYYDNLILKIGNEQEQASARILIEEVLIQEERRMSLDEVICLKSVSKPLLLRLLNSHILRSEPNSTGSFSYEVCHDTLIAPIMKAKNIRKIQEEHIELEKQRLKDLLIAQEKQRKQRKTLIISIALAVVFFAIGVFGIVQWYWAKQATNEAIEEKHKAEDAMEIAFKNAQEAEMALDKMKKAQAKQMIDKAKNYLLFDERLEADRLLDSALKLNPMAKHEIDSIRRKDAKK